MNRTAWVLSEGELRAWLQALVEGDRTVVAPVAEDGVLLPRPIAAAEQAVIEPRGKTRWSPKEFLFPRSEALYRFAFKGDLVEIEDPPGAERPQVLFGVRSCDAAGLARLDDVFLSGRQDSLYASRRAATTVVSTACGAADPECFCTAVGGSPAGDEGVDVQLVPIADGWLLRVLSDAGASLVGEAQEAWTAAAGDALARVEELAAEVAGQMERGPIRHEWAQVLEGGFEDPAWERLADHCLGCSVCAYVCPSCSCFDMNHDANAWCGEQCRSWDACTFPLFTRHASGHNPRGTRGERYRQRVLHKFAFNDAEDAPFRCVGCGRCVALCPAGLDIAEIVTAAATAFQEEGTDAAR